MMILFFFALKMTLPGPVCILTLVVSFLALAAFIAYVIVLIVYYLKIRNLTEEEVKAVDNK